MSDSKITLSQLESHLWEAANILRGPVDAADFKSYVFPLLFFKRLSDVHDEEHEAALKEFEGDEEAALFPENYGFQIPEDCHWRDVRKVATNVGQALQTALRGIEQANPHTLYSIFGDAQWTNKDRLSDALLRDLIEHFSRLSLGNAAAKADVLGQSYEYLIKKFADTTNKKAGEFYTPRSVVRLMVNILDPREGESIYDPTCGTGGMLLEAIHHITETRGEAIRRGLSGERSAAGDRRGEDADAQRGDVVRRGVSGERDLREGNPGYVRAERLFLCHRRSAVALRQQLRYMAWAQGQVVALLGFGAAAWTTAPRDRWIGWTSAQRASHLHLVINNARFLILPWVNCRNLASRILGMAVRRLALDWHHCLSVHNHSPRGLRSYGFSSMGFVQKFLA